MNKYLSQLVELCEFDKQLDGFKPKIEAAQEKLSKKSGKDGGAANEGEKSEKCGVKEAVSVPASSAGANLKNAHGKQNAADKADESAK